MAVQELSMNFVNAVAYAADAHAGQVRKGTSIPYISHPLAVASLILEHGGDEELAIAGLLHDVIEDCEPIYGEKIQEIFGSRVASIVSQLTDGVPGADGQKPEWRARKEAHLTHMATASPDVLLVAACDKIHNTRAILADVQRDGLEAFKKFNGGFDGTVWYLNAMAEATACVPAGATLRRVVDELFQAIMDTAPMESEGGEID